MNHDAPSGDPLTAALVELTAQAERVAAPDEREAGHYRETAERLRELAGHAGQMSARLDDAAAALGRHGAILDSLDGLDEQVAAITARLTELAAVGSASGEEQSKGYRPIPAPRWWQLAGEERAQAIGRLHAWVEQIYAPVTGICPPCSRRAGISIHCACICWTGSANSGPPSTSAPAAAPQTSPGRPNGKPATSRQPSTRCWPKPPTAGMHPVREPAARQATR